MLPLHDVALDDVERPGRRAKKCHACAESDSYTIKKLILRLQILQMAQNICSYIIEGYYTDIGEYCPSL